MVGIAEKAYLHRVQYISPQNKDLPVDVNPEHLKLGQMMTVCITNLVYREENDGMDYYTADFNENWKFTFQVESSKRISPDTTILMKMDTGATATVWPVVHDVYRGHDDMFYFKVDSGNIRTSFAISEKSMSDNVKLITLFPTMDPGFLVQGRDGQMITTVSRDVFEQVVRKIGPQNIPLNEVPSSNTELWLTASIGAVATAATAAYFWFH